MFDAEYLQTVKTLSLNSKYFFQNIVLIGGNDSSKIHFLGWRIQQMSKRNLSPAIGVPSKSVSFSERPQKRSYIASKIMSIYASALFARLVFCCSK